MAVASIIKKKPPWLHRACWTHQILYLSN